MTGKIFAILGLVAVFGFMLSAAYQITPEQWITTGTRQIYYVELPIGKFWTNTEGSFVFGCGSIDSTLSESYNIKYFKDGELRSLFLDASKCAIIPDGSFYFEMRVWAHKNIYGWLSNSENYYAIHVPALPQLNETLKWNLP